MNRIHAKLLLLLLIVAFAALTFAGTAAAGWTWDENGYTWSDDTATPS
jgi:hypothetical protein